MTTAVTANTHGNMDTYYRRMLGSLGDKKSVLPYITGPKVLDVGCGSGDLMESLMRQGFDVHGIDASPESVHRTAALDGEDSVVFGYADEIHEKFGAQSFDTIVCCSVLHEVFSYGNKYDARGQMSSLVNALASMHKALKPGGRLVVRDGVKPSNDDTVWMWVDKPEEVEKYLSASPFTKDMADRAVRLTEVMDHVYEGSMSSAMEFAFTYTWGPESFPREVQEYYGVFDLEGYARFVEDHGFRCEKKFEYLQPGYESHLEGKVKFSQPFPASNAIWVYTKI